MIERPTADSMSNTHAVETEAVSCQMRQANAQNISEGSTVRLRYSKQGQQLHRLAMVACINGSDVDLMFDNDDGDVVAAFSDIFLIEEWESEVSLAYVRDLLLEDPMNGFKFAKARGNALFGIKDFVTAGRFYSLAIDSQWIFRSYPPTKVLIRGQSELEVAEVMYIDWVNGVLQLLLQNGSQADCVSGGAVVGVLPEVDPVQTVVYMNRSRCRSNQGDHQLAAQDLTVAITLARSQNLLPQLGKCLYLRATCRMARGNFTAATSDMHEGLALGETCGGDAARSIRTLATQIEMAKRQRTSSNKRVARAVAEWCDHAMSNG